ncbi:MAG: alpha/beta hydrolase family protein [Anaerolineae bacterium]
MKLGRFSQLVLTAALTVALLLLAACGATPAASTATPAVAATDAPTAAATTAAAAPTNTVAAATPTTAAPQATATLAAAASPTVAVTAEGTAAAEGTPAAAGEGIVGQWEGAITIQGQDLGILVSFVAADGGYTGTMDVPAQSAADLPLANVTYEAPSVHFEAFSGDRLAIFAGEFTNANTITGDFSQAGFEGAFTLTRAAVVEAEPVLYRQEEVTFTNADASLAGTLTLPEGDGPFPAVVLISGSGQQNRDEEVLGFKVFGTIADYLTRQGIAVLRYDDRGIGGSTGDVEQATSEDFAQDALAAVQFLAARDDISPLSIGLIGHSEGGIIAPMVANQSDDVSYVVLLAAPAMPGDDLLMEQVRLIYESSGASQAEVDAAVAQQQELLQAIDAGEGSEEWSAIGTRTATQLRATVEALPTADRGALGDIDAFVTEGAAASLAAANTPWLRYFLTYDPVPAMEELDVPVLALYGSKDVQVAAPSNSAAMRAALEASGNSDATVEVLQDANHLFQMADTGSPDEYASLPKEFVPGFLDVIAGWILEHEQTAG